MSCPSSSQPGNVLCWLGRDEGMYVLLSTVRVFGKKIKCILWDIVQTFET